MAKKKKPHIKRSLGSGVVPTKGKGRADSRPQPADKKFAGKQHPKHKQIKEQEKPPRPVPAWVKQLPDALIILAYIFVVTFTPQWKTLDVNTAKFMNMAFINLVAFFMILTRKDYRQGPAALTNFFTTHIGLVYTAFMLLSLLSFTKAINLYEAVHQFARLFTVFMAVLNLSAIIRRHMHFIKWIAVVMTLLLLFDALSVFYYVNQFIQGEIPSMLQVKSIYSNRNVFASAVFIKLVFALYLLLFEKRLFRILGGLVLVAGMLGVLFIGARAFLIGVIGISVVFVGYNLVRFLQQRQRKHLAMVTSSVGIVLLVFLVFTTVQQRRYPERSGRLRQSLIAQIATLRDFESISSRMRMFSYQWSLALIRENPVLGVGPGNWRVNIPKYENQLDDDFQILYHAHSDFLQFLVETGIPGGLAYMGIFFLTGWTFLKRYRKRSDEPDLILGALFLAAAGLAFYALDALFNFPADRPETLVLFVVFVSVGVAASPRKNPANVFPPKPFVARSLVFITVVLLSLSASVLHSSFRSAQIQSIVFAEIRAGTFQNPSWYFMEHFPRYPDISLWGESISCLKARYLLSERKYNEAIEVLRDDRRNPYDSRREHLMATAYMRMGDIHNAVAYAGEAYALKPNYRGNWHMYKTLLNQHSLTLINRQEYNKAHEALNASIAVDDNNPEAYRMRAFTNTHLGYYQPAIEDVNRYFETNAQDASLLNLRGACLMALDDMEAACRDFEASMKMGYASGTANYERFCRDGY